MYSAELKSVTKKIKRLIQKGKLVGKSIYIFGVSENTRQIIKILRENGYEPQNVVDNDSRKWGSYCAGLKVVNVTDVVKDSCNIWLIYSFFWREMYLQLKVECGINENQIVPLVQKEKNIWGHLVGAFKGRLIYIYLRKKYGKFPIYLCPYTGTGDIYLIGTFWKQYLQKEEINDYIFIVISKACQKVAMLFDIKNIVLFQKQQYASDLISYFNLCSDIVEVKILNDAWSQINDNSSEWFRGYKGWYFTELFRKWVFGLTDECKPIHPTLKDFSVEVDKLFLANELIKGKTVILSPYSNTLSDLPMDFWEKTCDALKRRGYTVCTNSSGKSEPAVKGSKAVFPPLNIAPQFVSYAGGFIGMRSGFCDVISGATAKKVILYDARNLFYNCTAFEYFSLKNMGLCDDVVEVKFEINNLNQSFEKVMENF